MCEVVGSNPSWTTNEGLKNFGEVMQAVLGKPCSVQVISSLAGDVKLLISSAGVHSL